MPFDPVYNSAPGAAITGGNDYAQMLQQGFGGIGGVLQKNRDYAAGLAETKARLDIAGSNLALQKSEAAQRAELARTANEIEAAKFGLKPGPEGGYVPDPAGPAGGPAGAAAGTAAANARFDNISGLRKEVQNLPSYKNAAMVIPIYKSMVATAGNDNRASDIALVYGLAKIFDPTSVVREGEQVVVRNAQGLPDQLLGAIEAVNGKAALQPEVRTNFINEARIRSQAFLDQYKKDTEQYRGIAKRYGIDENDILLPLETDLGGPGAPVVFPELGDPVPITGNTPVDPNMTRF